MIVSDGISKFINCEENMKKLIIFLMLVIIIVMACEDSSTTTHDNEIEEMERELHAYFDSLQLNTEVPGIVAGIWMPSKQFNWVKTFGYADLENATPMSSQLNFRIASNTKTMTNTVLLQLVDEGELSLDDNLAAYVPEFPNAEDITIQMLTNMTSGIPDYTNSPKINEWLSESLDIYFPLDSLLTFAAELDFLFPPGEGFYYSNTNTILIQKIIEQITGNSLKQEMKNRLFDPLGLNLTEYFDSGTQIPDPHSRGYYMGEITEIPEDYTETFDISLTHGAGGAVSNIYELKKYVEYLVNGGYISTELQQHRFSSLVEVEGAPYPLKYGTGWMEWNGFYGHDGGFPGFVSLMLSNPEDKTTVILWYNCQLFEYDVLTAFNKIYSIIYNKKMPYKNVNFKNFQLNINKGY
jgi:D-alanyl-D-alanine carboxypeptidase